MTLRSLPLATCHCNDVLADVKIGAGRQTETLFDMYSGSPIAVQFNVPAKRDVTLKREGAVVFAIW